ncbi:hypothetical protein AVEN_34851-1 [Araneus ventricosus]|uniref:Uncharacterized protein n=1 Tax=Araneus ventricosus TaxID=182803 RepID=A0A4Y2LV05_ARAVE|nr:hypothetical protein AVEN_34851-1 [Araneus ventricosus]
MWLSCTLSLGDGQSLWFAKRSLKPYNLPLTPHLAKQKGEKAVVWGENDFLGKGDLAVPAIPVTADLECPRGTFGGHKSRLIYNHRLPHGQAQNPTVRPLEKAIPQKGFSF